MPIPFLVIGGVVAASAASAAAVKYLSDEYEKNTKDKRIAVVGPRMAGKSSTLAVLQDKPIKLKYKPTSFAKPIKFTVDTSKFTAVATDLSGDVDAREAWSKEIKHADLLIFVVSASALLTDAGDVEARSAASYVAGVERTRPKARTILLLTHPDQTALADEPRQLVEHDRVQNAARIVGAGKRVAVADLTNPEDQAKVRRKIAEALR